MTNPEKSIQENLTLAELNAIGALVDICRADWERRPAIIQAFLDATARRIVASDDTLGGQARLEGTRLSVEWIRDLLINVDVEEVLEDYPQLMRADLEPFIAPEEQTPESWMLKGEDGQCIPYFVFLLGEDDTLPIGVVKDGDGFVTKCEGRLVRANEGDVLVVSRHTGQKGIYREDEWEELVAKGFFSESASG